MNRYSGELQIILKDLPADKRVNAVGKIPKNKHILAAEIESGKKFRFRKELK
ncbi:phospho-sugar glycosidase domain-containing protein [Tepidanaerobacter syntrophicus]|uniref:phospho-sugar glycosidase domain-containing protein n=1 Tax=Tepidanaerobacter syntrophicus TaxID=224999 RepID=UPI0035A22133